MWANNFNLLTRFGTFHVLLLTRKIAVTDRQDIGVIL